MIIIPYNTIIKYNLRICNIGLNVPLIYVQFIFVNLQYLVWVYKKVCLYKQENHKYILRFFQNGLNCFYNFTFNINFIFQSP